MRGNVLKQQTPVLLMAVVMLVVLMNADSIVIIMMRAAMVTGVAFSMSRTTAAALVGTEASKLLHKNSLPLAEQSGTFLLLIHRVVLHRVRLGSHDIADHQLSAGSLHKLDLDVGNAVDEDVTNLDDVELNHDKFQRILLTLGNWACLHTEAKVVDVLLHGTLETRGLLVLSVGNIGTDGSSKTIPKRIRIRVELKAVQHQTVGIVGRLDAEVQL